MDPNVTILVDITGKLLILQAQLGSEAVSEFVAANIASLHLYVDNMYRTVNKMNCTSTSSSVLSKELLLIAPNDAAYEFLKSSANVELEHFKDFPLPWLSKQKADPQTIQGRAEHSALHATISGRVEKKNKDNSVRKVTHGRAVLPGARDNRSSPSENEDEEDGTEYETQAVVGAQQKMKKHNKYRDLARLAEQIETAGPSMMLAYCPKPADK